ncbi:MAG: undecaprenyldiphospho-muramoylpentapeptide beta-N-acetylglucosaminyltransferase [Deltaproteobacteria bacterium]|nr:undecaprenyldiphospho-muramoylpentapeptide beta-N-acetylglucosaminyltransferase [Deltaproteobacteria bacterium]
MNILIAGGGTGGHLFPGIAVAKELVSRDANHRILFVGSARGIEVTAVPRAGFELILLPISGLRRKSLWQMFIALCRVPIALLCALVLVRRFRPDVALSVGGYAAFAAIVAAWFMGVPCMVIEQNSVAGLTNRILSRFAKHVVVPLPTKAFAARKLRVLGNPVRPELVAVGAQTYAPQQPFKLLVFGGSQGAKALNEIMLAIAAQWQENKLNWSIVHQTGKADYERVVKSYETHGMQQVTIKPFIENMAEAYLEADLVLCRAGATTVAELTVCGRPSILVPYPFAVDDHQSAHARVLAAEGAAVHLPQSELSAPRLISLLFELQNEPIRLVQMATAARKLGKPDAALRIADLVIAEARHV